MMGTTNESQAVNGAHSTPYPDTPFDEADMTTITHQPGVLDISTHTVDMSPFQPRIGFDAKELQSLADSIATGALIDPITVRVKEDGRYELVSGERRYRAHLLLGRQTIPAVIKQLDDQQSAILAIASNTAREGLSDFELGMSYRKLLDNQHIKSVVELSRHIGVSRQQIDRCLDYPKLPLSVISQLETNPKLFGANCAEFFASHIAKGQQDNVILAVDMLMNGHTEKKAMQWLKAQSTASQIKKRTRKTTPLFFGDKQIGTVYLDKGKIIIQCASGSKPSDVLDNLLSKYAKTPLKDQ